MREIKFRAWDKKEKCFVNAPFKNLGNGTLYAPSGNNIDCELMQFTGLKDKNGKEIYEGDIVKSNPLNEISNETGKRRFVNSVVYFEEGNFKIDYDDITWDLGSENNQIEVIGNIYENKDLLN